MKIFTIILSFFLACVGLFANVGWTLVEKEGKAYIGYDFDSERKVPPTTEGLSALLAKRDKSLPLKQISFWAYFNNDPVIQGELLEVFHTRCPKVLSDALRSAGNMHNPKVLPLRSELPDCLLMTPTIKKCLVVRICVMKEVPEVPQVYDKERV
jgi:hypothetical protein